MSKKNMSLPKLVKAFRNLRDKRSELKAEFEAQDKALVEQQEKIQSYLLTRSRLLRALSTVNGKCTIGVAIGSHSINLFSNTKSLKYYRSESLRKILSSFLRRKGMNILSP